VAEGLVPNLPELSAGDTLHGQGLPSKQQPCVCPGWSWAALPLVLGTGEKVMGRVGMKIPPGSPKSEEEEIPP